MPDPIDLIAAERRRQVEREGWTPDHDDSHTEGDLAQAAACYALGDWKVDPEAEALLDHDGYPSVLTVNVSMRACLWPWDLIYWKPAPDDRIRELVKAGALIVAEIERLQRRGDVTIPEERDDADA